MRCLLGSLSASAEEVRNSTNGISSYQLHRTVSTQTETAADSVSPPSLHRPSSAWTIHGRFLISARSTRAGPRGRRRPCSQFFRVPSGTPNTPFPYRPGDAMPAAPSGQYPNPSKQGRDVPPATQDAAQLSGSLLLAQPPHERRRHRGEPLSIHGLAAGGEKRERVATVFERWGFARTRCTTIPIGSPAASASASASHGRWCSAPTSGTGPWDPVAPAVRTPRAVQRAA